jgi:hypothetical protein
MSTGSETKKKEPLSCPRDKEILLNGKRRNYCSHCNLSGHWEKKCWKLHPELRHTPSKKLLQASTKKEAAQRVMEHVINVPAPVFEEISCRRKAPSIGWVRSGYHFCKIEIFWLLNMFCSREKCRCNSGIIMAQSITMLGKTHGYLAPASVISGIPVPRWTCALLVWLHMK